MDVETKGRVALNVAVNRWLAPRSSPRLAASSIGEKARFGEDDFLSKGTDARHRPLHASSRDPFIRV